MVFCEPIIEDDSGVVYPVKSRRCFWRLHCTGYRFEFNRDAETLRKALPADERELLTRSELFVIDSAEGSLMVWAASTGFAWITEPDNAYLAELEPSALWDGGPLLKDV
jgi:hypothetical protein